MIINWYPGHMKKHLDITKKNIKNYDIILMVLDARLPMTSKNYEFEKIISNKLCIYLINKIDLVDDLALNLWKKYFHQNYFDENYFFISANEQNLWPIIEAKILYLAKKKSISLFNKRILILGIPNVGKSHLINNFCGKKSVAVANKSGLTQSYKYLKLSNGFEICDTPGILWPKFDSNEIGYKLSLINAIKKEILPIDEVMFFIINFMIKNYLSLLQKTFLFYDFKNELDNEEFLDFIEKICRHQGFLLKKNKYDLDRAYNYLLKKINDGSFFKFCLEFPTLK